MPQTHPSLVDMRAWHESVKEITDKSRASSSSDGTSSSSDRRFAFFYDMQMMLSETSETDFVVECLLEHVASLAELAQCLILAPLEMAEDLAGEASYADIVADVIDTILTSQQAKHGSRSLGLATEWCHRVLRTCHPGCECFGLVVRELLGADARSDASVATIDVLRERVERELDVTRDFVVASGIVLSVLEHGSLQLAQQWWADEKDHVFFLALFQSGTMPISQCDEEQVAYVIHFGIQHYDKLFAGAAGAAGATQTLENVAARIARAHNLHHDERIRLGDPFTTYGLVEKSSQVLLNKPVFDGIGSSV